MPADSFRPTPTFTFGRPPGEAPPPDVPACAPASAEDRPARVRRGRRVGVSQLGAVSEAEFARLRVRISKLLGGAAPRRRKPGRKIHQGARTVLIDRVEDALTAGLIDPIPDARPSPPGGSVELTR